MLHVRELIKNIQQIRSTGTLSGTELLLIHRIGLPLGTQVVLGISLDLSGEMELSAVYLDIMVHSWPLQTLLKTLKIQLGMEL